MEACKTFKPVKADLSVLRGLAVSNARVALSDFYNIAVRIADVAARLAVLGLRLRDKFGSPALP
jgi:hypothetical protein